jgi:hypothetical protein
MEYRDDKFTYEGEVVAEMSTDFYDELRITILAGDIEYTWNHSSCDYYVRDSFHETERGNEWLAVLLNIASNREHFVLDDELTNKVLELRELLRYKYECVKNHVYDEYNTYDRNYSKCQNNNIMGNIMQIGKYRYKLSDKFLQTAELDNFRYVIDSLINEQKHVVNTSMPTSVKSARN